MVDTSEYINVFKDALTDDSIAIQLDAIKKLPALAASLGEKLTREELIPCISNSIEAIHEEARLNLAEYLGQLVPYIGGNEHIGLLLNILIQLAREDEILVREKALETLQEICQDLDQNECEIAIFPLITSLMDQDWFANKTSASSLITMCYSKMSSEKQNDLRNSFRNLVQDESPLVRKSAAGNLIHFIPLIDLEELKAEFIPIFDNLSQDDQESVQIIAVDVGIAISKKLKDFEIHEFLLPTFIKLAENESWKVRQRVACKLFEIQTTEKLRDEIVDIYKNNVRDRESEVRVFAAQNISDFVVNLSNGFDNPKAFLKYFEEIMVPEIHLMLRDPSDNVRLALSTNLLALTSTLNKESFDNHILPIVTDILENEELITAKENILKNLNTLPSDIDITKSFTSIKNVFQNLITNSQLHWRARRTLLLAFAHIVKRTSSDFFDGNLNFLYQLLLNDPICGVRRTAPIILPLLVKKFGIAWAKKSLLPCVIPFYTHSRYLYRCIILFSITELIFPSIDNEDQKLKNGKYLNDFKKLAEDPQSIKTLTKIVKMNEKIQKEINNSTETCDSTFSKNDLSFFAEDTLDSLKKESQEMIFAISEEEVTECYLEGLLTMLISDFIRIIKTLLEDPMESVQDCAKATLNNVREFSRRLSEEASQTWVQKMLKNVKEEDLQEIEKEIDEELKKNMLEEETIDCDIAELENEEAYEEIEEVGEVEA